MTVVIIGGGVMGASTAWHLAHEHGQEVVVLERDTSYAQASSALSACAIRQQFSTEINIRVSQASLAFYRDMGRQLATADHTPDIGLVEPGYLYLAATSEGARTLRAQHTLQQSLGVTTALLDAEALRQRFPWMQVNDVHLGSLGISTATSGEGWFDGYAAMQAFRHAAIAAGVTFVEAEAVGMVRDADRVRTVRTADGREWKADQVVIAAGAWSAGVAALCDVVLPVAARKRDVFAIEASVSLPDAPLLIDPSGVWCRPEKAAGQFLCGAPPRIDADDVPLSQVDHALFEAHIWPVLAARIPEFDALRVMSSWAGYYEMNTFDHNGLVGLVAPWANVYAVCGFSGHGLQQAPAVGRGLAELMATGAYQTLDLSPFTVDRIAAGQPLLERNVI
jgi:FAD-dependent oxidoreductase domain-containing protein 1